MKLRFFTFIILFFSVIGIFAQEISVKSFRLLPEDLTARVNPVKNDNAQTCALVKIVTTERGFEFDPDALGMCKSVDETHAGEVWIWLAPGSRRLTIRHSALGVLRNYEYPVAIESACTYEMVLTTAKITTIVEEQNKQNFLRLSVSPADALVKIDGSTVVTNDGQYAKMLPVGEHTCECFCPLYHSEKQSFTILPDEKTSLNITLKPNYGYIKVTSAPESDAAVYIDGRQVGTTPYTSNKLESKSYTVQVAKEMWQETTQQVTVADNQTSSVSFTLLPNFAEPVFTCSDAAAEIWINGEKKGTGRWSGRLPAGPYKVETKKASHTTATKQITLSNGDNSTIALAAPTPIYGKISVNSDPFDADILLDGKKVGTTPELLNDILIGSHEIKLQKQGCTSVTRTVTVKEGETAEVTAELATGRQVMLKSDPTGAALYVDGSYAGTAPYSVALSFGTHTVKAVNDGVTKQETITVSENGQSEWTLNVRKDGQSCGTVKDYDGNTYTTVQIGEQCWMKENLRTTHYADGNSILYGTTTSRGTTIPQDGTTSYDVGYWYYPDNNSSNKATYGLLYNWKAVMSKSSSSKSNPSGVQGICPKGWHVPSDAEWTQLENYVGSRSKYVCGENKDNIAKALAATTGWMSSNWDVPDTCDVGGNPSINNATGFSALPAGDYFSGGYRNSSGYRNFGSTALFWSATEYDSSAAYDRGLYYYLAVVYRISGNRKNFGFSVRCLRN